MAERRQYLKDMVYQTAL